MEIVPTCNNCGATMKKRKGQRGEFWGCSNFPTCRTTMPLEGDVTKVKPTVNPESLLMDEIQNGFKELNERLDAMATYLSKHLK